MKTVYELNYKLEKGNWNNVLFSSKKRAEKDLKENYYKGKRIHGSQIEMSFVMSRIVF